MPWQTVAALVCIKVKADTHQSYDYMYGMTIVVIIKMGCGHSQIDNDSLFQLDDRWTVDNDVIMWCNCLLICYASVIQLTILTCFSVATLAATFSISRSFSLSKSSSENLSAQSERRMEDRRGGREKGRERKREGKEGWMEWGTREGREGRGDGGGKGRAGGGVERGQWKEGRADRWVRNWGGGRRKKDERREELYPTTGSTPLLSMRTCTYVCHCEHMSYPHPRFFETTS